VPERFPGGLPFSGREYLQHLARVHQALFPSPGLLVLDEAWTGLDQAPRRRDTWSLSST
jgi:ABC-type molybdenum transport system ATPase subunit/photorepair protein PhrA